MLLALELLRWEPMRIELVIGKKLKNEGFFINLVAIMRIVHSG